MKLDRNITNPRRGKYALIKLREDRPVETGGGHYLTFKKESVDFGDTEDSDFFVIRLKDRYAAPALKAYAEAARGDDLEYSNEIYDLARKAEFHPGKWIPD